MAARFAGVGGDPVVRLQSIFGEGETHASIALDHLAGAARVVDLPGVEDLLNGRGLRLPAGGVRRVVLVTDQSVRGRVSHIPDGNVA